MLDQKGAKDWGIIIGVIIVILLGIVIYASVAPESSSSDEEENGTEEPLYTLLDASPGELKVANTTEYYFWNESHGGLEVNGLPVTSSTQLADEVTIEQGVFSGSPLVQVFVPSNYTVSAHLFFNILGKTGGDLIVKLNGKEVTIEKQTAGSDYKIELPKDKLTPGTENKIEISVSRPFWMAFWKSYSYDLEGVYLDQELFNPEAAKQSVTISLGEDQVVGIASAQLAASVNNIEKAESKRLTVTLNGEKVYDNVPGAINGAINEVLPMRVFAPGDNVFEFATEVYGGYNIDFALNLRILNLTKDSYAAYEFKQTADNIWPYIEKGQAGQDYTCDLEIERTSGAKSITVWINDKRNVLAFPAGNVISENICRYLERDKNTIMIIAEQSSTSDSTFIDVGRISLVVRNK